MLLAYYYVVLNMLLVVVVFFLFFYLLVCVVSSIISERSHSLVDINSVVVFAVSCCNKVEIQQPSLL